MSFELERPLIFLDLETTGIRPTTDRILEIGLIKLYPNGDEKAWSTYVNPGVPIPAEASGVHKITQEMIANAPTFGQFAGSLHKGLQGCDFGGYNCRAFDLPFLKAEFQRVGMEFNYDDCAVVDGFKIWSKLLPKTLSNAVTIYLAETLEGAHGAMADTRASLRVAIAQLQRHPELPRTPRGIHDFCFKGNADEICDGRLYFLNGDAVMNFGKHKGKPLKLVDRGWLVWMLNNAKDLEPELRKVFTDALAGVYPKKP